MRKNPYNKDLKDHFPFLMQGPSTTTALITNEAQTDIVEKAMSQKHKYEANGVSFIMIQPPLVNLRTMTSNPQDILNVEMGQTEVTQELFEAVMGWNISSSKKNPQNPVEDMTWFDCIAFCNKLSELLGFQSCYEMADIQMYNWGTIIKSARVNWDEAANGFRLPTEYEWKSFAKAGTQNRWSGTDKKVAIDDYVWHEYNSRYETHPVGEKLPNEWGLYDMSGNVWEWCWSEYAPSYENTLTYRRPLYGGSNMSDVDGCQISEYTRSEPSGDPDQGFRICRTIK